MKCDPDGLRADAAGNRFQINKGRVISRKTTGDKRAFMSNMCSRCSRSGSGLYLYPACRVRWLTASLTHFVHTVERYVTYPVDGKIRDRFAEGILLTLVEEGPESAERAGKLRRSRQYYVGAHRALNVA